MMVDLKVMAYFKISLSTRNWDSALFIFHHSQLPLVLALWIFQKELIQSDHVQHHAN